VKLAVKSLFRVDASMKTILATGCFGIKYR